MEQAGRILVVLGVLIVLVGLIMYFIPSGTLKKLFDWFGNLPGDVRIERDNFRFYFPITTMVVVSLIATFVLWLVRRLFG